MRDHAHQDKETVVILETLAEQMVYIRYRHNIRKFYRQSNMSEQRQHHDPVGVLLRLIRRGIRSVPFRSS
jgi:hypothetical protein